MAGRCRFPAETVTRPDSANPYLSRANICATIGAISSRPSARGCAHVPSVAQPVRGLGVGVLRKGPKEPAELPTVRRLPHRRLRADAARTPQAYAGGSD